MGKIKYQVEATPSQDLTAKAFALQQDGRIQAQLLVTGTTRRFITSGECPRCGGHFSIDRPYEAVIVKSLDTPADLVVCNALPVSGTPEGKLGCGACFSVYAPLVTQPTGGAK